MLRVPLFIVAFLLAVATASADIRVLPDGQLEAATTTTLVRIRHGSISQIQNLATSRILESADSPHAMLLFEDGQTDGPTSATTSQSKLVGPRGLQQTRLASGATVMTSVTAHPSGGLLIQQEASAPRAGLESLSLSLPGIRDADGLLIPTGSGLRLDSRFEGDRTFEWPGDWRVQTAFIDQPGGGILLKAEDPALQQFKSLRVRSASSSDTVSLSLVSEMPQPVINKKTGISARWLIRAYEGGWQAQAEAERKLLEARAPEMIDQRKHREWLQGITLVVTPFRMREISNGPLDLPRHKAYLDELARHCEPGSTLLNYAYDWRREELDTGTPGQEVNPGAKASVEYARNLGFRIMLSIDLRCDVRHPLYPQVRAGHMRYGNPRLPPYGFEIPTLGAEYATFVQKPLWKVRGRIAETQLAAINPAAKMWRDLFLDQMARIYVQLPVYGIHVNGFAYVNDANGIIEDKNSVQGYRELVTQLRRALPPAAILSVDAWDEVTSGYADMAQLRLPGQLAVHPARPADMRFDDELLPFVHPVSAMMLRPSMIPYAPIEITNPAFARACAAWDLSTAYLAPLGHAASLDERTLKTPPESLEARFALARSLRASQARVDPQAWRQWPPRAEWRGEWPIGSTLDSAVPALRIESLQDGAGKARLIYSVDGDGRYSVSGE